MNIYNKTYLTTLIIVLTFFTLINFSSCDDGPTEPEVQPGRRDYTWEIDTLAHDSFSRLSLTAIWGESATNIWVGGSGWESKNNLWHYDGQKWSRYERERNIEITGFYAIDRNNIWASSMNYILHFNGGKWSEYKDFTYKDYKIFGFNAIDGYSDKDMYAVGSAHNSTNDKRTQICVRFDGAKKEFLNITERDELLIDVKVDKDQKLVFIDGYRSENMTTPNFKYILKGDQMIEILNTANMISMGKIANRIYHVDGKKIFRYYNNKLNLAIDLSSFNYAGRIWGRSEKDFFGLTWDFTIAHFNGLDLKDVLVLNQDYFVEDALIFENEVFFIYENLITGRAFVLHGVLE